MFQLFNKKIMHLQEIGFDSFIIISYFLVFISFIGLSSNAKQYLETMDYYVRIYICLFLILRFNPLKKFNGFTNLDKKIAFSAGLFILTSTVLNRYLDYIKNIFNHL